MLYRLQKKHDDNFDGTEYSGTMLYIFEDCYILPNHPTQKRLDSNDNEQKQTDMPYDELFIWSLLLYSGHENDLRLPSMFAFI